MRTEQSRRDVMAAVVALQVAPAKDAAMASVAAVEAVAGRGLMRDRYFKLRPGSGSSAVTLIEAEALLALEEIVGVRVTFADSRRNILTKGIRLNSLVGRAFHVGTVILRGTALCQPCWHIAKSNSQVLRGLVNRGGLRAEIMTNGLIAVYDPILPAEGPHRAKTNERTAVGAA